MLPIDFILRNGEAIVLPNGPYVPWDVGVFKQAVSLLRANMGTAITVGFWGFILITGVFTVIHIAKMFFQ